MKQELTAIMAARAMNVSLSYLYQLLWTAKLPGRKVGKQWRISAEAVQARLKNVR